jgi:hypothetical protein
MCLVGSADLRSESLRNSNPQDGRMFYNLPA